MSQSNSVRVTTPSKQRLIFLGDSITVGVGDSQARGWPSRLCQASATSSEQLHCYNLGIGGDLISDLSHRVANELEARFAQTSGYGAVVMIGVNDALRSAAEVNKIPLVMAKLQTDLEHILACAKGYGDVLVIEPAPVLPSFYHSDGISGDATMAQLKQINTLLALACERQNISLLRLTSKLKDDAYFMTALHDGDGLHPHDIGYDRIASHIQSSTEWLNFVKRTKKPINPPASA